MKENEQLEFLHNQCTGKIKIPIVDSGFAHAPLARLFWTGYSLSPPDCGNRYSLKGYLANSLLLSVTIWEFAKLLFSLVHKILNASWNSKFRDCSIKVGTKKRRTCLFKMCNAHVSKVRFFKTMCPIVFLIFMCAQRYKSVQICRSQRRVLQWVFVCKMLKSDSTQPRTSLPRFLKNQRTRGGGPRWSLRAHVLLFGVFRFSVKNRICCADFRKRWEKMFKASFGLYYWMEPRIRLIQKWDCYKMGLDCCVAIVAP